MLFAAEPMAEAFFPPWYFWLFVLAMVSVIFAGIATIVYLVTTAETQRQQHERETAARLLEVMIVQRKMTADEIEQIFCSYYRTNNVWNRITRWFKHPDGLRASTALFAKPSKLPN